VSLIADHLSYHAGGRPLLSDVSLSVEPGCFHAILGPNGAGKSTLLRLLARELQPAQGRITLDGRALAEWEPASLARQRAVLPQSESLRFGFKVAQVVALGRLPCLRHAAAREAEIIEEALRLTDALHLKDRIYPTLSGGERQRVQLARVLVQIWDAPEAGARYLLLDEPTSSLDLRHQHDALRVAKDFAARGAGVAAVLHDPNLALQYADEVSLLCGGALIAQGAPAEVLSADNLRHVYGVEVQMISLGHRRHIAVI